MWPFAEICKHYWDCNTQTKSIFKATNDWDPLFLYRQKLFWKRIYTVHQIFYEIILYYQITLRKCVLFFVLFFFNFLSSCMLPIGEGRRNVKLRDLGSCIFDLSEIIQKSLKIHCWRINWISLVLQDRGKPQWSGYCLEIYFGGVGSCIRQNYQFLIKWLCLETDP